MAEILGFRDSNTGLRSVPAEDKDTHKVRTLNGEQNITIINESGSYTLVLRSNKPKAKQIKKGLPQVLSHSNPYFQSIV